MSTYIKGPICGIDNCPSQLWRIIAGRRTCQYGHVMEGDVEFNNDDDMTQGNVITRRLNLTTNATGSFQSSLSASQLNGSQVVKDRKVYGKKARILFLNAFQHILKRQCKWLIEEIKFPKEFNIVVKCIWMKYLQYLNNGKTNEQDMYNGGDTEVDNYDTQEDLNNNIPNDSNSRKTDKIELHITSTIAILYMASVHIGLPVYMCDFTKWICSGRLPYYKANLMLPDSYIIKLPNYYLGLLEGGKAPGNAQLLHKVSFTCAKIKFCSKFNAKINKESLLLKLVMFSTLPPEFFFHTLHLINLVDEDENFELFENDKKSFKSYQRYPELRILSYFILSMRWILRCDGLKNNEFTYPTIWIKNLLNETSSKESSKETRERRIANLFYNEEVADPFIWNDEETVDFLDWIENKFLTHQCDPTENNNGRITIDQKIAKRKLHKIIPLESDSFQLQNGRQELSFTEELQEKYIRLTNHNETGLADSILDNRAQEQVVRQDLIFTFETKLTKDFAAYFGVSTDQLKYSIDRIEKNCMNSVKGN